MADETTIEVNFGRPMALFPLDSVVLLPQQLMPLHIFEPRYRQMVQHVLDGSGQFATAVFEGDRWRSEYHGSPPLRRGVCVGQIVQHERLDDGRYNILARGVCRARIVRELKPDGDRLYRAGLLEPVGLGSPDDDQLYGTRERLRDLLAEGPLTQLRAGEQLLELFRNDDIPTSALLELVSFTVLSDREVKYRLLAEGDPGARAELVETELLSLGRLIRKAAAQRPEDWPKGCSWN